MLVSSLYAQVTELKGNTTLTWDQYQWELWGMTAYRASVQVQGEGSPRIIELPIIESWIETEPGTLFNAGWPTAFSPIRELTAIPEGRQVCFKLLAHDGQTSGYSNEVCVLWPKVCEFSTREELCTCLAAPSDCIYVPPE